MPHTLLDPKSWDLRQGLSLYIHIPFCTHKCYFCDFFSVQGWSEYQQEQVIQEIFRQTKETLALLGLPEIKTAYIGGGTPSLLSPKQLDDFLSLIQKYHPTEITVEANPESFSQEWCDVLFAYKNTRLSLGIQSFLVQELEPLGRIVQLGQILQALKLSHSYAARINLDLMAGFKGHTWPTLCQDLDRLLEFQPGHISFYMLTIEQGTPLFRRKFLVAEEDERIDLWIKGKDYLNKAGYIDYEISNFTKNHPSRHNQRYWRMDPYIGIGPGAVGTLPLKNGGAIRIEGLKNLQAWIKRAPQSNLYESLKINKEEFFFEHLMMGWRTKIGVDKETLEQRFHDQYQKVIETIEQAYPQWVINDQNSIRLSDSGRIHLDKILIKVLETQEALREERSLLK